MCLTVLKRKEGWGGRGEKKEITKFEDLNGLLVPSYHKLFQAVILGGK